MISNHILPITFLNVPDLFFRAVKWFHQFQSIANNSIEY